MEIAMTRMPSVFLMSLVPCMPLLATSALSAASNHFQTADEWQWRAADDSLRVTDQMPAFRLWRGIELKSLTADCGWGESRGPKLDARRSVVIDGCGSDEGGPR
jgi:hypothetical protein